MTGIADSGIAPVVGSTTGAPGAVAVNPLDELLPAIGSSELAATEACFFSAAIRLASSWTDLMLLLVEV